MHMIAGQDHKQHLFRGIRPDGHPNGINQRRIASAQDRNAPFRKQACGAAEPIEPGKPLGMGFKLIVIHQTVHFLPGIIHGLGGHYNTVGKAIKCRHSFRQGGDQMRILLLRGVRLIYVVSTQR